VPDKPYEFDPKTGRVLDCFGNKMNGVDDFVDELNMLRGYLQQAKEKLATLEKNIKIRPS